MAALVAVAAVALACVALIGRDPVPRRHPAAVSSTAPPRARVTSTTRPPATTTSTRTAVPAEVGQIPVTVSRGSRRFAALVLYPATRAGADAPPLRGRQPYPLIVFSPGFDIDPAVYRPLLTGWVAAGFVVAEPYYPFTAPGAAGGVDESDIVQHPADLRAVVDQMQGLASSPGDVLSGMVDPARIGVAGHSDGGDVTDAVVADTCCRDPRVRAAEVLSGAELTSFGGTYGPPAVPLLVVQGDADGINAPACSEQIYEGAGSPRYYLDLHGAGHLPPYTSGSGGAVYQQAVLEVTTLFWQAYLGGAGPARDSLTAAGVAGSAGTLTVEGAVAVSGACPGAP